MTPHKTVAIIGGGLSGGAVACYLAQQRAPGAILVFEPRAEIGPGLAYGTDDPSHRINVPAAKMSLLPAQESHFVDWIARTNAVSDDAEALAADGQLYVRRSLFGRYVYEHIQPFLQSRRIEHVQDSVASVEKADGGQWSIETFDGRRYEADIVVLATTHPPPAVPDNLHRALAGDPRMISDATVMGALSAIEPSARVVIVGTGLTMVDVVASLDRQGHRGQIHAFSRRGLLPRGHAQQAYEPFGEFVRSPPYSTRELLRKVRSTIKDAAKQDIPWQPVIDAVRSQALLFWPQMPVSERAKIVKHLRAYWDVHRFRVAPQLENVIRRRQESGTLTVRAASLVEAVAGPDAIAITVRSRRTREQETISADYIVVTTGPAHGSVVSMQPHLATLARQGLIAADPFGLGISCNVRGQALAANGDTVPGILIAGPLARGTFGELMGVPQVTNYALSIASEVLEELKSPEFERGSLAGALATSDNDASAVRR